MNRPPQPPSGDPAPAFCRILLAEDGDSLAAELETALRQAVGPLPVIRRAGSLDQALGLLEREEFEAVVLEPRLPGGPPPLEALQAVRRLAPFAALVVYTGGGSGEEALEAFRAGAGDYLDKSAAGPAEPAAALARVLERNLPLARLAVRARRLEESEASLRRLVDMNADAIVVVDRAGVLRFLNPAARELFGRPEEELLGRTFGFPLAAGDTSTLDVIRPGGRTAVAEMRVTRTIWGGEEMHLAALRDMTDRHRLEEQVRQAQKLESLGVVAGGVAHDFNNLLMGILGHAELALESLPPGSEARSDLEAIVSVGSRAAGLTRQMLAYSGRGRFQLSRLNLSSLVKDIMGLLKVSVSKKARLVLDLAPVPALVEGDPGQIQQVAMNLMTNASEALEDKPGEIRVTTGLVRMDRKALARTYLPEDQKEGEYAFLEVADTGVGMGKDILDKIFDPFFTTKFTGRGLGLAAVLGIVRAHHGALEVRSQPGRGTVIRVMFPAESPGRGSRPVGETGTEGKIIPAGATVLVIDDEPPVLRVTGTMLKKRGVRVLTASTGREGLEIFRRLAPGMVDMVLLDLTMPDISGVEVYRELMDHDPRARVIITTGHHLDEVESRFGGLEGLTILQKPYRSGELHAALARELEKGVT